MARVPAPAEPNFSDYYRVLAENAEDHIFVISRDDTIEFVNTAAARQHRRVPSDLIGRKRTEIFPPEIAERQGQNLRQVFETGRPVYVEARTIYEDREVWLSTWLAPVADADGGVKAVLGVSRDLTERKRADEETRNAQKLEALGRLAGGIAHDFNNNLTAILGYVDMLIDRVDPREPIARDLNEVRRAAERSAGLVRRLLAFGRRQVLQTTTLDLHGVIRSIGPMLERLLGEHVRVDVLTTEGLLPITGDASELEQVIINLALNARDAMPSGGTLTIETSNTDPPQDQLSTMGSGPYVLMRISDTGEGMSPHVREHVFDPFFTTKAAGHGTGLGLSAVYGIIKQLNGFIWVESQPSSGSTFYVYLPAATGDAGGREAITATPAAPESQQQHTILLVEDEETVRRFVRRALQTSGFRVLEATSPEDAVAIAERGEPITLLLTDVVMPRMSGPELARRLKASRPDLPVLYMSGYAANSVLAEGDVAPAVPLLAKPFTTSQLVARIYEALRAHT
jgi:two-component system, cell cycle sensor histidine kinase and response regulator CckA